MNWFQTPGPQTPGHRANEFAALCCTDGTGKAIRQATLHRELQGFLDTQRRALVEPAGGGR